jgi:hypothetical protein
MTKPAPVKPTLTFSAGTPGQVAIIAPAAAIEAARARVAALLTLRR